MKKSNRLFLLTPVVGIFIFVLLYVIATFLYPGGSQANKNSIGFSWLNNYWCNLLNDYAINGKPNTAKPVAVTAMLVLCVSLSIFWILFPRYYHISNKLKIIIQVPGVISMITAFFLFLNVNHDTVINLAGIFGVIALGGTLSALYKTRRFGLFAFGVFNILQVALNNFVYYTHGLLIYLPVIQKISFSSFLIWICCMQMNIYRKQKIFHNGLSSSMTPADNNG